MRTPLAVFGVALFVGHGGQPLESKTSIAHGASQSAVAADAADIDASRFLAAARGAAPVICSLAAAPLGEGWGYDRPPVEASTAESGLLAWALQPSLSDRDLSVLGEGIRDDDPCVRTMAARLLGSGGTAGARILIDRLRDADAGVRASAAWALGEIEDRETATALAHALADPETIVRLAAIEALGRIELEESIEALLPMLHSDDARIRATTARAIGRIL